VKPVTMTPDMTKAMIVKKRVPWTGAARDAVVAI
jgi:hypothetical protein